MELKSTNKFSTPQQSHGDGEGDGPSLIQEPALGFVVIKTDESNIPSEMDVLASIPGVQYVERNPVMHVLNRDDVPGASGGHGRRLVETTPWGIDMVNVTHLWDVS